MQIKDTYWTLPGSRPPRFGSKSVPRLRELAMETGLYNVRFPLSCSRRTLTRNVDDRARTCDNTWYMISKPVRAPFCNVMSCETQAWKSGSNLGSADTACYWRRCFLPANLRHVIFVWRRHVPSRPEEKSKRALQTTVFVISSSRPQPRHWHHRCGPVTISTLINLLLKYQKYSERL